MASPSSAIMVVPVPESLTSKYTVVPMSRTLLTAISVYGMSLSYLSADGTTGAASSQVLADTTIASNVEFTIMTDNVCNGDCGYVRPNSVAYREC